MCVLDMKPFVLLVGIQHTQCPVLILRPGEIQALVWSQNYHATHEIHRNAARGE